MDRTWFQYFEHGIYRGFFYSRFFKQSLRIFWSFTKIFIRTENPVKGGSRLNKGFHFLLGGITVITFSSRKDHHTCISPGAHFRIFLSHKINTFLWLLFQKEDSTHQFYVFIVQKNLLSRFKNTNKNFNITGQNDTIEDLRTILIG